MRAYGFSTGGREGLTYEEIRRLVTAVEDGVPRDELARRFRCHASTVGVYVRKYRQQFDKELRQTLET
jgi:transposase